MLDHLVSYTYIFPYDFSQESFHNNVLDVMVIYEASRSIVSPTQVDPSLHPIAQSFLSMCSSNSDIHLH